MPKRKTNKEFIEEAKMVHGNKYDYSKVVYVNNNTKVEIVCPEHGSFFQRPNDHLKKNGCPKERYNNIKGKIYGKGINDLNCPISCNGIHYKFYQVWKSMFRRCYSLIFHTKQKTYSDCTVCDEWLLLSNFKRWFDENYIEGYCLDKDIRVHGNRIYSPQTCCFIPKEINTIFITNKRIRGEFVIGVSHNGSNYTATLLKWGKTCYLGVFATEEEAFLAYKREKESFIKEVANKYKDKLSEIAYNALMNYEVKITD